MKQIFNPYLPLYEYIPDGEPHIYQGRLYIYGSHDQFGAFSFCHNNYVTWSCPIDDLASWRYEGVIYDKREDPDNRKGRMDLYAPDVTKGPDGAYYLYYSFNFYGKIGVAKSNKPNGPFHYFGHVHYADGTPLGRKKGDAFPFDPGVLTDLDGKVYLYSGFGAVKPFPQIHFGLKPKGGFVMELKKDMLTIKKGPIKVFAKADEKDTLGFPKEHAFFEASSIRRIKETYYFIYSSLQEHELCYAKSQSPFGPFTYGGVIVSNGDVGYLGKKEKEAVYPLGNNHGSIIQVKDQWYVFYHRHTNYTNTDRQGCAEKIKILNDGSIPQVEITSCGLNPSPLKGEGSYPSSICCCLIPKKGNIRYPYFALPYEKRRLRITQSEPDSSTEESQYIQNVKDGSLIGYKYFDLRNTSSVVLNLKGNFEGTISLRYEEKGKNQESVTVKLEKGKETKVFLPIHCVKDKSPLYFFFAGKGKLDFYSFTLERKEEHSTPLTH